MYLLIQQFLEDFQFPEMSVANIAALVAGTAMIFGGVVPYIPQYLEIKRTSNAEGFSTFVCLTLIIANILRILFWFGHPFEMPLFIQSIVMIITMFAMVYICTVTRAKNELIASKPRAFTEPSFHKSEENFISQSSYVDPRVQCDPEPRHVRRFQDFDRKYFWRWSDFDSYIQSMCVFSLLTGGATWLLLDSKVYVETLGFLAVFFEAMLGAPQYYRNYQNKSTKGMSVQMVLCWTMGDIFKTAYFLVRHAPTQFWMCGMLQVSLDLLILLQVFYYKGTSPLCVKKEAVQ